MAEEQIGVIPRAMHQLFTSIRQHQTVSDFTLRVSYLEIYNEEIRDLLLPTTSSKQISIREDANGDITVMGSREEPVETIEELTRLLEKGAMYRATGRTLMNEASSRSHAIFTVLIQQRAADDTSGEVISAKFHLVDLAGSERNKRTGAVGTRFKESIKINEGLLALGNVISALAENKRGTAHIPYRQSKLTRILKDSLGGNARTLMVACISPADNNFEETHNTLKYANRAKHIKNKPIVNRDVATEQLAELREEIKQLQQQLADKPPPSPYRAGASAEAESPATPPRPATGEQTVRLRGEVERLSGALRQQGDVLHHLHSDRESILAELQLQIQNVRRLEHQLEASEQSRQTLMQELAEAREDLSRDEEIFSKRQVDAKRIAHLARELKKQNHELASRVVQLTHDLDRTRQSLAHSKLERRSQEGTPKQQIPQLQIPVLSPALSTLESPQQIVTTAQSSSNILAAAAEEDDSVQVGDADESLYESPQKHSARRTLITDGGSVVPQTPQPHPPPPMPMPYAKPSLRLVEEQRAADLTNDSIDQVQARQLDLDAERRMDQRLLDELQQNIRMKEELIQEMVQNEQKINEQRARDEERLTKMQDELDRATQELETYEKQAQSKSPTPQDDEKQLLLHRLHIAEKQLLQLRQRERETAGDKLGKLRRTAEKRAAELESEVDRMKQQQDKLRKKQKEDSLKAAEAQQALATLRREADIRDKRIAELQKENQRNRAQLIKRAEEAMATQKRLKEKEDELGRRTPFSTTEDLDQEREWIDSQVEEVMQQREAVSKLERTLREREQKVAEREQAAAEKHKIEAKRLRKSQAEQMTAYKISQEVAMIGSELHAAEDQLRQSVRQSLSLASLKAMNERVEELQEKQRQAVLQQKDLEAKIQQQSADLTADEEAELRVVSDELESLEAEIEYKTAAIAEARAVLGSKGDSDPLPSLSALPPTELKQMMAKAIQRLVDVVDSERRAKAAQSQLQFKVQEQKRLGNDLQHSMQLANMEFDRKLTLQQKKYEAKIAQLLEQIDGGDDKVGLAAIVKAKDDQIAGMQNEVSYYKKNMRDLKRQLRQLMAQQADGGKALEAQRQQSQIATAEGDRQRLQVLNQMTEQLHATTPTPKTPRTPKSRQL
eukprot:TRINITY_DN2065_c0_g1_i1.p1 TRINITY_DN2065_c0_g1~~TRINITY_DN2065_c0_g1_i1.p1  ORF type:complete len:1233 (+),score=378.45 TRINITY_DN2065_c0_g1_i1:309-3701(+)